MTTDDTNDGVCVWVRVSWGGHALQTCMSYVMTLCVSTNASGLTFATLFWLSQTGWPKTPVLLVELRHAPQAEDQTDTQNHPKSDPKIDAKTDRQNEW